MVAGWVLDALSPNLDVDCLLPKLRSLVGGLIVYPSVLSSSLGSWTRRCNIGTVVLTLSNGLTQPSGFPHALHSDSLASDGPSF